ncbi:hypothetical protein PIB30_099672 [Stylosanthes scabra]|uniref:Uncharacterized protein n=1 Tax=Stylosanthes scabra TaxID=79078 RepID=A0ABU6YYC5_9FABA|nr:hypothetical protein [Stylosanthes scabra]
MNYLAGFVIENVDKWYMKCCDDNDEVDSSLLKLHKGIFSPCNESIRVRHESIQFLTETNSKVFRVDRIDSRTPRINSYPSRDEVSLSGLQEIDSHPSGIDSGPKYFKNWCFQIVFLYGGNVVFLFSPPTCLVAGIGISDEDQGRILSTWIGARWFGLEVVIRVLDRGSIVNNGNNLIKWFRRSITPGFQHDPEESWIRKLEEEENREDRGNSSMSIHA